MIKTERKLFTRARRRNRIRARVSGTAQKPRLAVFRSNRFVYAQLIDDVNAHTLAAADTRAITGDDTPAQAHAMGAAIAAAAAKQGITTAVFDRGGFGYQGIIAAVAEGARAGGLTI